MRIALVFGLALAACSSSPKGEVVAGEQARSLLLDRNWIDKLPESRSDKLFVFRFVPSMGGGVFQDRTIFKGTFELFKFEHTSDEIRFDLLHTDEVKKVRYRIESITPGEDGFDLRLVLDGSPRGPSVYYGWRNEGKQLPGLLGDPTSLSRR